MSENEKPSEMSLLDKSDTIPPGTIIQLQPGEEVWNFPEQLTAAVGRMRRLMAGEPRQLVYVSERRYELDKAVLSDAYLAEHPADDEEPISEQWLLDECNAHGIDGMPYIELAEGYSLNFCFAASDRGDVFSVHLEDEFLEEALLPNIETRRQVRQLLRAFNVGRAR